MPSFRVGLLAACALFAGMLVTGCSGSEDGSGETLKVNVGVVQSLSGSASIYGKSVLQGIEMAVDEVNESEDKVDMTITLIDDESTVEAGTAAFGTLRDRHVNAIIGPTLSNIALEAMPVAQAASIPVLGATNTAQGINEIGDYVFRVALTEEVVVPATVERVNEDVPIKLAAMVLDSSDAFSRSSAEAMREGIDAIGGKMYAEVDVANTDIKSALPSLHGKSLDAILITPLVAKSVDIVKAIRADGFQQIFIGGNSFNTPSIASEAGTAVEGAYVGSAWNPGVDTSASKRFVAAYTERFGEAPDLFAAQGYSSVYLLLDAVKRAGTTDGPALRDALAGIKDVGTPMGSMTMSDNREAVYEPVVQQFEAGELVVLP